MNKKIDRWLWNGLGLLIVSSLVPVISKEFGLCEPIIYYSIMIIGNIIAGGLVIYAYDKR